jgi:peptide chain release factor 2
VEKLDTGAADAADLLEMAAAEDDEDTAQEIEGEIDGLVKLLEQLEFRRMFSGEMDPNNAFLDIQAGSGGTEAQDWAEMMLRERHYQVRGRVRLWLAAHRDRGA